jgi:hypothetical protein
VLVIQEKPYFLFIENEYADLFLHYQIDEIYEILLYNFNNEIPVVSYEHLNDNQTYNDLLQEVIIPNFKVYFERKYGLVDNEEKLQKYLNQINQDHYEILESLREDVVKAMRYHDMFFTEAMEDVAEFTYNPPTKKVW